MLPSAMALTAVESRLAQASAVRSTASTCGFESLARKRGTAKGERAKGHLKVT